MRSLQRLGPHGWLNDEIINSVLMSLPPMANALLLDSFFYTLVARKMWHSVSRHRALGRNGRGILVRICS